MYYKDAVRLGFGPLRRYALTLLSECRGASANVLRARLESASTQAELLRMRAAIFQCISMHLGEAEAMDRIRSLDLSV